MTNKATELLPCPFCGGNAALREDFLSKRCEVRCADVGNCEYNLIHKNREDAIKAWNTRQALQDCEAGRATSQPREVDVKQIKEYINENPNLEQELCCSGFECGCRGSSHLHYVEHLLDQLSQGYLNAPDSCEACENKGKVNLSPDDDGRTHPCEDCKPIDFENWKLKVALGYHINADSYGSTFPDNEEDQKKLRKSETYNRLKSRTVIDENLSNDCVTAMKSYAYDDVKDVVENAMTQLQADNAESEE